MWIVPDETATDRGLKSRDPAPHGVLARALDRHPDALVVINVLAFLAVGWFALSALGGYGLDHAARITAWTNAGEAIVMAIAVLGLALSFGSLRRPAATCRRVNVAVLLALWPADVALIVIVWAAKY